MGASLRRCLAIAVGTAMLSSCGPITPTPPRVPDPSSATSREASVPPTDHEPDSSGWTLVAIGDPASGMQFSAAIAVPDGFVVTGSTGQAGEIPIAIHSTDG